MKAAVLCAYKQPIRLMEVPAPVPGPDEVLIKVEACGVCHSDLHLAEGDWPQLAKIIKLPLILGHEVIGRVVGQGNSVEASRIGERVGVPWIHWTCGECDFCREGRENLCIAQSITGATVDGGYSEFIKAKASHALRVPDALSPQEAAPLFCAGVTVYRAIKNAGVRKGQRVAIFGIGGLGHLAVQIAKTLAAELIAIDIAEDKLALGRSLGADQAFNAANENIPKLMRALGGAHFAIVASASKKAYDAALSSLRRGGTLVVVGVPAEDLTIPPIVMVGGEFRMVASAVGTREDLRAVLELAASGRLRCHVDARPLEQVNQVFDDMRAAAITGRIVLTP